MRPLGWKWKDGYDPGNAAPPKPIPPDAAAGNFIDRLLRKPGTGPRVEPGGSVGVGPVPGGRPGVLIDGKGAGKGGVRVGHDPDDDRDANGNPIKKVAALVPLGGVPVIATRRPEEYRRVSAEPIESLLGPTAYRPQDLRAGAIDFRNWMTPSTAAILRMDAETPVVCHVEVYGAQGGTTGVGRLNGAAGAGSPWIKTMIPGQRYPGGTAAGGLCFLPPEVSLTDMVSSLAPKGVTLSAATFCFARGTYAAWGLPNLATGGVYSGWRASGDANGNLLLDKIDSTAATVLSMYPMGTIYTTATQTATIANMVETTLASYTLAAGALGTSMPDSIIVRAWGSFAGNGNAKTIRLRVGTGTTIVAYNDITASPNGTSWKIEAKCAVRDANTLSTIAQAMVGAAPQSCASTAVNTAIASTCPITLSGQNGVAAANDIVLDGFEVEKA